MQKDHMTVVVDGGGSGCRLAVFDARGTLRAKATGGPASLSLGVATTWQNIARGLTSVAEQIGQPADWKPDRLCMGLSGALQEERRREFLALIPSSLDTTLVTDGQGQLVGATGGAPGICLAMGTGSVIHWMDTSGAIGLAGGWGFPMGDEGSGAWLGARLINAYLWHRDTRARAAPRLFRDLEARIGSSVSQVQSWSTRKQSTDLAGLVPILAAAAEGGDPLAGKLLRDGAEECERLLALAPRTLPIYLVGGLAEIYRPLLSDATRARLAAPQGDTFSGLYAVSLDPHRYMS